MQDQSDIVEKDSAQVLVEGLDFYFEKGMMVLTRRYLQNRGFCCSNDCRHCPYGDGDDEDL